MLLKLLNLVIRRNIRINPKYLLCNLHIFLLNPILLHNSRVYIHGFYIFNCVWLSFLPKLRNSHSTASIALILYLIKSLKDMGADLVFIFAPPWGFDALKNTISETLGFFVILSRSWKTCVDVSSCAPNSHIN